MMRTELRVSGLTVLLIVGLALAGCGLFKVQGQTHMKVTKNGETVAEKTVEFDSLEELPGAMRETAQAFGDTSAQLMKELTEAPPPGQVRLADLSPSFASVDSNPDFDFIALARSKGQDEGHFTYVQIGVPSYDQFFKSVAEMYALVFQTRQLIHRMREMTLALTGQAELASGQQLSAQVQAALQQGTNPEGAGDLKTRLLGLSGFARVVTGTVSAFAQKTQQLIATGQQLITAAPSSITNPKTILHLDLILQGLKESLMLVAETGKQFPLLLQDLAGF